MSLNNEEAVVEETELENNLEQTAEESSEQPKSEEGQDIANPDTETEQVGDEHDDIDLSEVLSGKAEPEENNESKVPRSTIKARRKNKRQEKEIEALQLQVQQLTNQAPATAQAVAPERDWDNETDEQYNFRSMQAVLNHQQQVNSNAQQHADNVKQANEGLKEQQKVIDKYSESVDKLNFSGYDDAESKVLDAMPEGSLAYMSKMNPEATSKIIWHLAHNENKLADFANLAHTNAQGFNYQFGKLETQINELESSARRKRKSVSKATGDKSLDNSGSSGSSLQSKMDAAANKGDFATYRKLKAQSK